MQFGVWQLLIIAVIILVLFGRGRISEMMGDFGKGINSFKKGMSEDEAQGSKPAKPSAQISPPEAEPKPAADTVETPATDKTAG